MEAAPSPESSYDTRRSFIEDAPMDLFQDLRLYEQVRADKLIDDHNNLARAAYKRIKGADFYEPVIEEISLVIGTFNLDPLRVVDGINYYLKEDDCDERIDYLLNINTSKGVVLSGITADYQKEYLEGRAEEEERRVRNFAVEVASVIVSTQASSIHMVVIKCDLVFASYDNIQFSVYLNEELNKLGSAFQFNQYLELID